MSLFSVKLNNVCLLLFYNVVDNFRDICDKSYVSYPAQSNPVISSTPTLQPLRRSCQCDIISHNPRAFLLLNVVRMARFLDGDLLYIYLRGARYPYSLAYNSNYLLPDRNYTASDKSQTVQFVSSTASLQGNSRVFIRVINGKSSYSQ